MDDSHRARRARLLRAAALLAITIPFAVPLLEPGWLQSHEGLAYPIRLTQVLRCWEDGFWSARWSPDLNAGQGYPFLSFYAPLFYWAAGVFRAAGASLPLALKLPALLGALVLAAGTYRLARRCASPPGAFAAAAFALYAPYLARDVYIRGDLAEFLALAFLPWALAAVLRAGETRRGRDVVLAGVAGTLPILTHNITGLVAGAMMAVAGVLAVAFSGRRLRTGAAVAASGALTLLLSAFFWAPALQERAFVRIEAMTEGVYSIDRNFVSPLALLGPPRLPGTGQDLPMSWEISYVALVALGLLLVARREVAPPARPALAVAVVALVAGFVMSTRLGAPVYDALPLLRFVQFPWRFLGLLALGLAVVAGFALDRFLEGRSRTTRRALATGAVVVAAASVWPVMAAKPNTPIPEWSVDPEVMATRRDTATGVNEYLPRWVEEPGTGRGFEEGVRVEGDGSIEKATRRVGRYDFRVTARESVVVVLRDVWVPGWRGDVGGVEIELSPRAVTGNIELGLAPGEHDVRVRLGPTPFRAAAQRVSLGTAAVAFAVLLGSAVRSRRKPAP